MKNEMTVLKNALKRQIKLAEKWRNRCKDLLLQIRQLKSENERLRERLSAAGKFIKADDWK